MTMQFDPSEFGPVLEALVDVDRLQPLDAGAASLSARDSLERATVDSAFDHTEVVDAEMAKCCLAGIWLLHGFLDESHTISQAVGTTTGSFWHGVMHRREGDYSNAKYWFRRVGRHGVFEPLGQWVDGASEVEDGVSSAVLSGGQWDPFAFVDVCQSTVRSGTAADDCRRIQQREWELLFEHSYRSAIGR